MKLAFSTLGCPGWTLERAVESARDLGYEGIELRLIDDQVITPDLVAANRERIKRAFGQSGVELAALGSSARFSAGDRAERAPQEAATRELVRLARELGAPAIRVFGGPLPAGVSLASGVENVADSLNRLAPAAEDAGVALLLETHDDFSRAATVADVLSRVPSKAVGALWDTQPPHELGESVDRVWELIGARLMHLHVKDARPGSRPQWDLVLLGEGVVPVRDIVRSAARRGFSGYASVEWEKKWHPEIPEPEVAFPRYLRLLREYLAEA